MTMIRMRSGSPSTARHMTFVQVALGWDLLVVVKDQDKGAFEAIIKILEIAERKDEAALLVFRRENGQGSILLPCHRSSAGKTQVVEEGRNVEVPLVDLVPHTRRSLLLEIAGRQRGLSGSGRSGDPCQRVGCEIVQESEKASSPVNCGYPGSGDLCYCGTPFYCPLPRFKRMIGTWGIELQTRRRTVKMNNPSPTLGFTCPDGGPGKETPPHDLISGLVSSSFAASGPPFFRRLLGDQTFFTSFTCRLSEDNSLFFQW
jgi:hypothetical protein